MNCQGPQKRISLAFIGSLCNIRIFTSEKYCSNDHISLSPLLVHTCNHVRSAGYSGVLPEKEAVMFFRTYSRIFSYAAATVILMHTGLRAETFLVTTTADTGPGSLRQAIVAANSNPGPDVIAFAIPDSDGGYDAGTWTITPLSELTNFTDSNTLIDGYSQRDYIGGDPNPDGPEIILDGTAAGNATGLEIKGNLCTVQHLTVYGFYWDDIRIYSDSCSVLGCYLGTGRDGASAGAESGSGCGITIFGDWNFIGGVPEEQRNVISGNTRNGIEIAGGIGNTIAGNYIGLNAAADAPVPNNRGIFITQENKLNVIGPDNIIAGNTYNGINFFNSGSDSNRVFQNIIGTNHTGAAGLGNGEHGIRIDGGIANTIGGETEGEGNIISGNGRNGIAIYDSASATIVAYNAIGVAPDGITALGNQWSGLEIHSGAYNNTIGPKNIIAYNSNSGVTIQNDESSGNRITENSIFQNGYKGINLTGAANDSIQPPVIIRMGSVTGTARPGSLMEIFSTESDQGRDYEGSTWADGSGNFHWDGTPAGPYVTATATDPANNTSEFSPRRYVGDLIVTTTADTGAGSLRMAVLFAGENSGPDTISFAIPETDPGFDAAAGVWTISLNSTLELDEPGTCIDGMSQSAWFGTGANPDGPAIAIVPGADAPVFGIEVSANSSVLSHLAVFNFTSVQIKIESDSNLVEKCYLCCGADGEENTAIGTGIWIIDGHYNTIGGSSPEAGNVISGMAGGRYGLQIYNQSSHTVIAHNIIGLDAAGDGELGGYTGISISSGGTRTVIGPGNIIAGLQGYGIMLDDLTSSNSKVFGNLVGTDITGTQNRGNGGSGIYISGKTSLVTIGGLTAGERNIISGNQDYGIVLMGIEIDSVTITGNYIGTAADGISAIPNEYDGIQIYQANHNTIGGTDGQAGNVISGNNANGIVIFEAESGYNLIAGNAIGVTVDGAPLANSGYGVLIYSGSHYNMIGPANIIANNGDAGVVIMNAESIGNTITRNSIYNNSGDGIVLTNGANYNLPAPIITALGSVTGTAPAGSLVEVFSGPDQEGKAWIDSVTADGAGNWTIGATPDGPYITATATDTDGNTSPFSYPLHVGPYMVTNTLNSGEGSLRAAMEAANANPGPDSIHFAIPRSDAGFNGTYWSIVPTFSLPIITDNGLTIDGTTQDSLENANPDGPDILLDGSGLTGYPAGFALSSANNEIAGLTISGFYYCGIYIRADSARANTIRSCYIGTDPTGADTLGSQGCGILIEEANGQLIGGETPAEGNLISGNRQTGCRIVSDSNQVLSNIIGLDRTGTEPLPNRAQGLEITGGYNRIGIVRGGVDKADIRRDYRHRPGKGFFIGNLISGNSLAAIRITGESARENSVIGNTIGLDASGETVLGNAAGVELFGDAVKNSIRFNTIAGSTYGGVDISGADSSLVQGNFIGITANGSATAANGYSGVILRNGSGYNLIGGEHAGEGNILSGNVQSGIEITGGNSDYNRIIGNFIGTGPDGVSPLPNQMYGIYIHHLGRHNVIGPDNRIAYNVYDGVLVSDDVTWGNRITANSIFSNGRKGINLLNNGNYLIAAPLLTGTNPLTGTSSPGYLIEIFSDSLDQGRIFEDSLRADGSGNFTWHGTPAGPFLTTTATTTSGSTSMFSDSIAVSTSVDRLPEAAPRTFALRQNYPNPFNPVTTIVFDVAESCQVTLKLFDIRGRKILTLIDKRMQPGTYQAILGADRLPSGTYIYRITMGRFQAARKMTLIE